MDTTDPAALLASLDPERLRDRLDELDREARAVRVLLRASLARRRSARGAGAAACGGPRAAGEGSGSPQPAAP